MPSTRSDPSPDRLRQARLERGLTQEQVAEKAGLTFNSISRYETGSAHPSQLALNMLSVLYDKPVKWLLGEASEAGVQQQDRAPVAVPEHPPASRAEEGRKLEGLVTEIRAYLRRSHEVQAASQAHKSDDAAWDPVPLREVTPAAGAGAEVFGEEVVGYVPFLRTWLQERLLDPAYSDIVSISGHSMHPTLPDGCHVLVDRKRREPRENHIYVMRTEEGLVVKRLGLDKDGHWEARSDNADWPPVPLRFGAEIIGEVRWSAVTY